MYDQTKNSDANIEPPLNQHELELIKAYRTKLDMRSAVDTLLGIASDAIQAAQPKQSNVSDNAVRLLEEQGSKTPVTVAAYGDDGSEPQVRMISKAAVERAAARADEIMAEQAAAEQERETAAARMRALLAQEDKKSAENNTRFLSISYCSTLFDNV